MADSFSCQILDLSVAERGSDFAPRVKAAGQLHANPCGFPRVIHETSPRKSGWRRTVLDSRSIPVPASSTSAMLLSTMYLGVADAPVPISRIPRYHRTSRSVAEYPLSLPCRRLLPSSPCVSFNSSLQERPGVYNAFSKGNRGGIVRDRLLLPAARFLPGKCRPKHRPRAHSQPKQYHFAGREVFLSLPGHFQATTGSGSGFRLATRLA